MLGEGSKKRRRDAGATGKAQRFAENLVEALRKERFAVVSGAMVRGEGSARDAPGRWRFFRLGF